MARPEAAHRVKSYSAATGYVYQHYFYEVQKISGEIGSHASSGTQYVFMVSKDRKQMFPLKVFIREDAVNRGFERAGQELTGTEQYAVAKMRLFQAFDEVEELDSHTPDLVVDDSNISDLLSRLDL